MSARKIGCRPTRTRSIHSSGENMFLRLRACSRAERLSRRIALFCRPEMKYRQSSDRTLIFDMDLSCGGATSLRHGGSLSPAHAGEIAPRLPFSVLLPNPAPTSAFHDDHIRCRTL